MRLHAPAVDAHLPGAQQLLQMPERQRREVLLEPAVEPHSRLIGVHGLRLYAHGDNLPRFGASRNAPHSALDPAPELSKSPRKKLLMYKSFVLAAAVAAAVPALSAAPARAQSGCDGLLNQKVTASGTILRVVDLETFVHSVSFRDGKTGCQLVLLEGLLPPSCEEGKTITVTGLVKRNPTTRNIEIDAERSGAAACR
jgi:hypothetical protein